MNSSEAREKQSPYDRKKEEDWPSVTRELIVRHPLKERDILEISLETWKNVWDTKIGGDISLQEIQPSAQMIGILFEKMFTRKLEQRYPGVWRGGIGKEDKDVVFVPDPQYSIEVKTSGQKGLKVFGNRSYVAGATKREGRKCRSGYYLTVNFYKQNLYLIRFGWVDESDWVRQKAETGQAAVLKSSVYRYKLPVIPGSYRTSAPLSVLPGIGNKKEKIMEEKLGITMISDLLDGNVDCVGATIAASRFLAANYV